MYRFVILVALLAMSLSSCAPELVTKENFSVAETEHFMQGWVDRGGDNKFFHLTDLTPLDQQTVPRMQADTLYSVAVVDASKPVKLKMPETDGVYQSAHIFDGEHYTQEMIVGSGDYSIEYPTNYGVIIIRTHVTNPNDAASLENARRLQAAVELKSAGTPFKQTADFDEDTLSKMHDEFMALSENYPNSEGMYDSREATTDELKHLVGIATGWGGNPYYHNIFHLSPAFDTTECRSVTFIEPEVDYFWSFTMYDSKGYMFNEKRNIPSTTAVPNEDGTFTAHFGDCDGVTDVKNHLPTVPGWNFTIRTYGPSQEVSDGTWKAPLNPTPIE